MSKFIGAGVFAFWLCCAGHVCAQDLEMREEFRYDLTSKQIQKTLATMKAKGFFPDHISGYRVGDEIRYAAVWTNNPLNNFVSNPSHHEARHDLTADECRKLCDGLKAKKRAPFSLSGYAVGDEDRYAVVWDTEEATEPCDVRLGMTADQFRKSIDTLKTRGYQLTHVSGYGDGEEAQYAALWRKVEGGPSWEIRYGLTSAEYQKTFNTLKGKGYQPVCLSGYSAGGESRFAAIWEKWEISSPWEARHDLTAEQFQKTAKAMKAKGYDFSHLSAFSVGDEVRFAAIWVKPYEEGAADTPTPKKPDPDSKDPTPPRRRFVGFGRAQSK